MRRWARAGWPIDWKNPAHVKAFALAKQTNERPRASDVLDIIRSQSMKHETVARLSAEFWVVQRSTFPNGPPPEVSENIVPEEELVQNYCVPKDVQLSDVLVVDMQCDRALLGRRVRKVVFQEAMSRQMRHTPSASSTMPETDPKDAEEPELPSPSATSVASVVSGAPRSTASAAVRSTPPAPRARRPSRTRHRRRKRNALGS